jgi:hypothetical protein
VAVSSAILLITTYVGIIAASLNEVLLIVTAIPVLAEHDPAAAGRWSGGSVAALLNSAFAGQRSVLLIGGGVLLVANLVIAGVMWVAGRRKARK